VFGHKADPPAYWKEGAYRRHMEWIQYDKLFTRQATKATNSNAEAGQTHAPNT